MRILKTFASVLTVSAALAIGSQSAQAQDNSVSHPTISPLPQKVQWGKVAFPTSVSYTLVGDQQADASAASLLRSKLKIADKGAVRIIVGEVGDKAVKKYAKLVPNHPEGYYLSVTPNEVVIAGRDESGTYYGVQTFLQLAAGTQVSEVTMTDWPSVECRGVIEGFYGNPWSHEDRLRQFEFYGKQKMNTYVYGPKDDPYHRRHWRDAYPEKDAKLIRELVAAARDNHVQFVWAIHPGVDIKWNKTDSVNVVKKLESMYELGVRTFAVFFDDIWGEGSKGDKQAGLLNYVTDEFVRKHKDVKPLIMCPTQYNKAWSGGDYLPTLGTKMYPEVRIMWTGNSVVDMIESNDMEWINGQIKRKAFIWLNYPVNDYCQSRLLMGKTYGNGLDINDMVSGFCSNPMEYAEASKVSLYSIADYTWNMPQYDSVDSWNRAINYLMPTNANAFSFFCRNNVDLGRTGHGLRREGESYDFAALQNDDERATYCLCMQNAANELLADSVNHPEMLNEIKPWVESMGLLGQRGTLVCQMEKKLALKDSVAFVGLYRAQAAVEQAQKAITSRNFEGSIVKAKPVVSGDVVTPWVNEKLAGLVKEYKKQYAYGIEYFPVQVIEDGEYFIKVNGQYLTDAEAGADRVGDRPVFQSERDVINPQRQQWVVEVDIKTGRYKITNKQDGRYINEVGRFWKSKGNPYDPNWNTYLIVKKDGKFSIQNAGNGGKKFWTIEEDHIGTQNDEQFIFEIEPVK
ncbi:MAG: beta-N-acetylglucosaminidase domain-containing protein [Bacteroidales bacterium]|nr:beta-N-acetylglucosaminidase domain-containing protein [Candidatus Physcousia equi]